MGMPLYHVDQLLVVVENLWLLWFLCGYAMTPQPVKWVCIGDVAVCSCCFYLEDHDPYCVVNKSTGDVMRVRVYD